LLKLKKYFKPNNETDYELLLVAGIFNQLKSIGRKSPCDQLRIVFHKKIKSFEHQLLTTT